MNNINFPSVASCNLTAQRWLRLACGWVLRVFSVTKKNKLVYIERRVFVVIYMYMHPSSGAHRSVYVRLVWGGWRRRGAAGIMEEVLLCFNCFLIARASERARFSCLYSTRDSEWSADGWRGG